MFKSISNQVQIKHLQNYNISSLQKLAVGVLNVLNTPPGADTDFSLKDIIKQHIKQFQRLSK